MANPILLAGRLRRSRQAQFGTESVSVAFNRQAPGGHGLCGRASGYQADQMIWLGRGTSMSLFNGAGLAKSRGHDPGFDPGSVESRGRVATGQSDEGEADRRDGQEDPAG